MRTNHRFVARQVQTPGPEPCENIDDLQTHFAVHCPSPLLQAIIHYSSQFRNTEIFGLLLGRPLLTPDERLRTVIEDYIAAQSFEQSDIGFVEVSASELMRLDEEAQERTRGSSTRIVGWFHTHPGHGIFMSNTDRENHRLYTQPWQVALVVDPHSRHWGFFNGPKCEPIPPSHVVQNGPSLPPAVSGENDLPPEKAGHNSTPKTAQADLPAAPAAGEGSSAHHQPQSRSEAPLNSEPEQRSQHSAAAAEPANTRALARNTRPHDGDEVIPRSGSSLSALSKLLSIFARSWRSIAVGSFILGFIALGAEVWLIHMDIGAQKKRFEGLEQQQKDLGKIREQLKDLPALKQQVNEIAKRCGGQ
jgi:proteasome lid subunit RPN8/RPN11